MPSPTPRTTTSSLTPAIPTPTHGPNGTFSIKATTHISAPPLTVLAAVRDTSTWPEWNTFCPKGTISSSSPGQQEGILEVGMKVDIEVYMDGSGLKDPGQGRGAKRDQGVEVTVLDFDVVDSASLDDGVVGSQGKKKRKGARIAWKATGYSNWQLRSERVMEFWDDGEGGTEYVCWETFGGVLARVVKGLVGGLLVDRFADYAGDLKGWCERDGGVEEVVVGVE